MDTLECILERRSIRRFQQDKLPRELVEEIVDHARFAPSWANTKTARYTCVSDETLKNQAAAHSEERNQKIIEGAPHLVVLSGVTGRSGLGKGGTCHTPEEWLMFDAGLAAQTFCLAAHDFGIGTIILGLFDGSAIASLLHIPSDETVTALIAMGRPDEAPTVPRRKEVSDILRFF